MAHYKGAAKEASRAMNLMKKRQKEQEELEMRKKKIEDEMKLGAISTKFAVHYDAIENKLKSDTIGLVTLNEMKAKQEDVVKERERQIAVGKGDSHLITNDNISGKYQFKVYNQKIALSFNTDEIDEEEENEDDCNGNSNDIVTIKKEEIENEESNPKKRRLGKNPDVDTSFLPDRDREEEEAKIREELRQEWVSRQEKLKNEDIEITYSYWDGSGHRRQTNMKKGHTVHQFLQKCLEQLRKEFTELKTVSVDQLMYVKEDLIIAHHYSFYDFIVTKARGKSGPLFNFDARDDIRVTHDAAIEKNESHAGKVCLRSWYEKNKHIFPASRWEPYNPEKKWDRYTVSDKEAIKITVK